jgi:hypothetical protein
VLPDSYATACTAAGNGASSSTAANGGRSAAAAAAEGPFYQQLARHAQYLEVRGTCCVFCSSHDCLFGTQRLGYVCETCSQPQLWFFLCLMCSWLGGHLSLPKT